MVALKRDLLAIVQDILNELDSDTVNSIDDTIEATQVAGIIQNVFFDLIANKTIPEHKELFRLDALGDNTRPTYLKLPSTVKSLDWFKYNKDTDSGEYQYELLTKLTPLEFMNKVDSRDASASNVYVMPDIVNSTEIMVYNDRMPSYWTTFDDLHIVCDAWDDVEEDTLQQSKNKAYGTLFPTFTLSDTFTMDLDDHLFQYVYNEALSRASENLKGTIHQKGEQWARRHKFFIEADNHRFAQENERVNYGRRGK